LLLLDYNLWCVQLQNFVLPPVYLSVSKVAGFESKLDISRTATIGSGGDMILRLILG